MKKNLIAMIAMLAAGAVSSAHAQSRNEVYGSLGTEGIGLGYGYSLSQNFGARMEVDGIGFSDSLSAGSLHYSGSVRLIHGALLADFFPAPHAFPMRLTAGVLVGDDQISGDGTSINGTYNINGVHVAAQGETIRARLKFPTVRPYVGIGFGHNPTARPGFSMAFDAGVAIGRPSVDFDVPANIANAAGAANVAAEEASLQSKAHKLPVYPVVKVALTYRW